MDYKLLLNKTGQIKIRICERGASLYGAPYVPAFSAADGAIALLPFS